MPEMNGAKLELTDPATGQVIEYEIVRVGTMREHRDLVKGNKEREAFESSARVEVERLKARLREAGDAHLVEVNQQRDEAQALLAEMTRQRDTGLATVQALQETKLQAEAGNEMREKKRQRSAVLMSKLEDDKTALESLLSDIAGTIDELHEG